MHEVTFEPCLARCWSQLQCQLAVRHGRCKSGDMCCRRQDEDLDQIGNAAQRLGHMGLQIHDELQTQNVMLEELDEDVEQTTSRLAAAQKKINTVLQKAGLRGQLMIIGILLVLLVILVLIAFS